MAPLTDNPNAPNDRGETPIYWAAKNGYIEIVKILAPLADKLNAPNNNGDTPNSVAENSEIQRFLESFKDSWKHKAKPSTKLFKK